MKQTKIKICGIRDASLARLAVAAGADAVGLVFYPPSPRAVVITEAKAIVSALPSWAWSVALFVNPTVQLVQDVIANVRPTLLQFHGDETPAFCQQFGYAYWKAVRVSATTDLLNCQASFVSAQRLLLDADATPTSTDSALTKLYGGTGEVFDWSRIPSEMGREIVLSGGLAPSNVGDAIRRVAPWGVDVSSGVEVQRGVKSAALIQQFIEAVRKEDSSANVGRSASAA